MQEKLSTTSGTDHDAVVYPVIEYMSRTLSANDDLKILLLCKTDQDHRYLSNIEIFKTEFEHWCGDKCQTPEYKILDIPFAENVENHSNLIRRIAAECEPGSSIVCDITYGAKSLPIILFSVLAFATQHLAPFVSRSVGAYRARTRGLVTFPFADAFLNFMQEGKSAQANPLRESYSVAIKTSAATINPDAAERLEYYEVSLTCRKGRQSVRNANYPNDAVFEFEPQNCGEGRISFSFPSLKLEYAYSDFRALLEDFSLGERVFSPNDFPEQADRMERLRIHNVRVRLLADDAPKVLSAFTGELVVPTRIVSTW